MAQYRMHDPEELLECPFDKVHMVRAKKFQYHLSKCRANHKGNEFACCIFNAKHTMPKPEHRHHLSVCPDKAMLEPEFSYAARINNGEYNMMKGCTETPNYNAIDIPCDEDWDSEPPVTACVGPRQDAEYYERVYFKDATQMGKMDGAIVSDRRLTNEQKISELSNDGDTLHMLKASSTTPSARQPHILPKEQPLSSVFAYSIGRGRGLSVENGLSDTFSSFGSDNPDKQSVGSSGIGRGIGRGQAALLDFYVSKVN